MYSASRTRSLKLDAEALACSSPIINASYAWPIQTISIKTAPVLCSFNTQYNSESAAVSRSESAHGQLAWKLNTLVRKIDISESWRIVQ
jgi:hypothetical protein